MTDQEFLQKAPKGAKIIHHFKNGNVKISYNEPCLKCGGRGTIARFAGIYNGVCFDCNGSGTVQTKTTLLTPENGAKEEAKRQKEEAERQKQIAEVNARIEAEEKAKAEEQARRDAELAAKKAISQHVGTIGERIEVELELVHTAWWEHRSFIGYGTETGYRHIMKDESGNVFTWKTSTKLYVRQGDAFQIAERGDKVLLKGTIAEHGEYNDEKQTVLKRCKVLNIERG